MTSQRGSDDREQKTLSQRKQERAEDAPARPSDVADESTAKLGEHAPQPPERPATPAAHRPLSITNAPTTLLSMPSQPEPAPAKPPPASAAARPAPSPTPPVGNAAGAPGTPRSRWGVPAEPEIRSKQIEEPVANQPAAATRPEPPPVRELSPVRPEPPPVRELSPVRPEPPPIRELSPAQSEPPIRELSPVRPEPPPARQEVEAARPEQAPPKETALRPGKEANAARPGAPIKEVELAPPPAPSSTGSLRFFWLQGVALRIAERIEGPLQEAPFWNAAPGRTPEKRRLVRAQAQAFLDATPALDQFLKQDEKDLLLRLVEDEVLGFGALEPLLADERVNEVMVVEPSLVYVERAGKMIETSIRFQDEGHLLRVIQAILRPLGRSVSRAWPMAACQMARGST
ncbi:MAG TPA: hypothetical protein VH590_14550 [Ktedonobacterales bacterium]